MKKRLLQYALVCSVFNVWEVLLCDTHEGLIEITAVTGQLKYVWNVSCSIRNCLNCVHNCDDHSLLDFKIRSSIYETFHISLHNVSCVATNHGEIFTSQTTGDERFPVFHGTFSFCLKLLYWESKPHLH